MDAHNQKIIDEFKAMEPAYLKLHDVVLNLLKANFSHSSLIAGIEARVKTEKSLKGKLELKGMKYRSVSDITDILGARIITFYSDDIETVAAKVENLFEINWEKSVDKRKIHESNSFGYMSLHYICRVPEKTYSDPQYPEINKISFEIQMRTALQHVWASIEHDMGYKSDVEIPSGYLRTLSRLAGLLEIADEEFKTFRTDITEYRRKVLRLVKSGKFEDVPLSSDSYKNYLTLSPFKDLTEKIASSLHAEVQKTSELPYYAVLKKIGLETLGDIEKLKKECSEDALRLVLYQIGDKDLDIISSTVAVHNLCVVKILKSGGGERALKETFDMLYGKRERNLQTAKRVAKQAESLNIVQE